MRSSVCLNCCERSALRKASLRHSATCAGGGSDAAAATNPALLHHVSREYGSDSNAPAEPAVYLHADGLTVCNDEHYPMLRDVMGAFVGRKIFAHWASNGRRKCVGTLQLKGLEKEVSCGGCVSVVVVELNLN